MVPSFNASLAASQNLRRYYDAGVEFGVFLEQIVANAPLWRDTYRLVRVPSGAVERLTSLPGRWHLLVMVEDWCGDAVNIVPLLARLVDATTNVDLRVIRRDENPELMDAHLTNAARSMPVVMLLDSSFVERSWWGPRPRVLQQWVVAEGAKLEKAERYREVRKWYAHDRGRAIADEVIGMVEEATKRAVSHSSSAYAVPAVE